jgi:hypothetical protein
VVRLDARLIMFKLLFILNFLCVEPVIRVSPRVIVVGELKWT